MRVFGEKKYRTLGADSVLVNTKRFEPSSKNKFVVGQDIEYGDVLKVHIPEGGESHYQE